MDITNAEPQPRSRFLLHPKHIFRESLTEWLIKSEGTREIGLFRIPTKRDSYECSSFLRWIFCLPFRCGFYSYLCVFLLFYCCPRSARRIFLSLVATISCPSESKVQHFVIFTTVDIHSNHLNWDQYDALAYYPIDPTVAINSKRIIWGTKEKYPLIE